MRKLSLVALFPLSTLISIGCVSPPQIRLSVNPPVVCPGEIFRLQIESSNGHTQGALDVVPRPAAGSSSSLFRRADGSYIGNQQFAVCQDTVFAAKFWKLAEEDCGMGLTTCAFTEVDVVTDDRPFRRTSSTCRTDTAFTFDPDTLGDLKLRAIRNCTDGRSVTVTVPGRDPVTLAPGEATPPIAGDLSLAGDAFSVSREVTDDEGCADPGDVRPDPSPPPAPPEICLDFIAGCDASEECEDG